MAAAVRSILAPRFIGKTLDIDFTKQITSGAAADPSWADKCGKYSVGRSNSIFPELYANLINGTRTSNAWACNSTGIVTQLTANQVSQGYDAGTILPEGLGCWNQIKNELSYTRNFSNAIWAKIGTATVTGGTNIAPDGTNSAYTLNMPATGDIIQQGANVTIPISTPWTASVWLRGSSTGTVQIEIKRGDTGTFENKTLSCAVTTAWKRFTVTYTFTVAHTAVSFGISKQAGTTLTVVDAWGAAITAGAVIAPTILSDTTPYTRTADSVTLASQALTKYLSQTAGTLIVDFSYTGASTNPSVFSLYNSASPDTNSIDCFGSTIRHIANGTTWGTLTPGTTNGSGRNVKGITYGPSLLRAGSNGASVLSTSNLIPSFDTLYIGTRSYGGLLPMNGFVRRIAYWPRQMGQAEFENKCSLTGVY